MIKNIHIKGFRGFTDLKIDDFKRINLFLGKNNCGKTSILEALFLMIGISNPHLTHNINNFRDLVQTEIDDYSFIFNKLDYKTKLTIEAKICPEEQRILNIKPHMLSDAPITVEQKDIQNNKEISSTVETNELIDGLISNFTITKDKKSKPKNFQAKVFLKGGVLYKKSPKNYNETINGIFVSVTTPHLDVRERLEKLVVAKQEDVILKTLQTIDPKIQKISLGSKNMIWVDIGYERYAPINIIGDGIRRLLSILTYVNHFKDGIVLIDEIENGLHYSSLKTLWQAVMKAAIRKNVQLFITTHSKETLEVLKNVLNSKEYKKYQSEIRSYTIRKHDDEKTIAYPYDYEKFDYCLEQEIEMR